MQMSFAKGKLLKNKTLFVILAAIVFSMFGYSTFTDSSLTTKTYAHSGRTDSFGGHNCYVGSCAGTYHYHNGGNSGSTTRKTCTYKGKTYNSAIDAWFVFNNDMKDFFYPEFILVS